MNSSWSFFQTHDLRSLTAAAAIGLVAGLGAASLRTTIASRVIMDSLEFLVIGAPLAETLAVAAVVLAIVVGTQVRLLRRTRVDPDAARRLGSARWALPLLTSLLPIAGVGAAMLGGTASGPAVYWFWEMAPWWLGCGALSAAARAVSLGRPSAGRLRAATGRLPPAVRYAVLGCAVAAWTLAANTSLRSWRGPLGDEPRYLRYIESWCQGGGIDIARIAPLAAVPRDGGPHVGRALALAVRTLREDVRSFAGDVAATLRDSSYSWNRMTSGDGSFVTGRDGGSYQSHQPGLSLVLLPGYVIDRHVFSTGTVYGGQFPDRLPVLHATLLLVTALGAIALAVLCRHIGLDWTESLAFGFVGWAAFPASAMALQVYPETCAALAILAALALLTRPTQTTGSLILAGALAGFPWVLHVRFVVVATVLALFGAWTLRRAVPRLIVFTLAWSMPVVAQLWFVYHATGIPWPTAFYRTAAQSVVRASVVPPNMLRFVADRDWGFLPHAPILLLLGAGFVALWRVRRDLAVAVAGVAVALTATAATHNVAAGGGTPGRLITGMMPLLFLPVAALTSSWKAHRGLRWVALILALVTLDQAWDYNRAHVKEVGIFVSPGASGWRINLMFPYLSDGFAAHAGRALIAVAIPAALALVLALRRRRPSAAAAWQSVAALIVVVIVCLSVAGAWRLWQPRYRMNEAQARAAVVAAYVRAGSCASCWSSLGGPLRPQELAANTLDSISLTATQVDDRRVSFALAAAGPDGPVFGTVRLDFGDGQVSAPEVMGGSLVIEHDYRAPGEYKVRAWIAPPGAPQRLGTATVRIDAPAR